MSEVQSYIFDFQRVGDFFERWNVDFKATGDFGVSNKFEIVLASYSPNSIGDCLENGRLSSDVTIPTNGVQNCTLNWQDEVMSIANDVTFNFGTAIVPIKAVFIRNKASEVVLGYSINIRAFEVTNQVVFGKDTIPCCYQCH